MKKQYLYPQNMRTEAKLWFWGLRDIIILAIALTVSVVSWAKLNFMIPAALLLRRDMKFLDDIQLQMSTAREFMFAYRITHESEDGALATLNRIEKNISDQGFEVKRADKDDIKRFLSRYFGHMTEDAIDDVDGERMIKKWIIPD